MKIAKDNCQCYTLVQELHRHTDSNTKINYMACGTCGSVKPSVQQPTIKVGFIKPNASALEVVMKATVIEKILLMKYSKRYKA